MKDYASWYVEVHPYEIGIEVSRKITTHLVPRITYGNAVIVCDTPHNWMPTFRKRWAHVLRLLENERAATLKSENKTELTRLIKHLSHTHFETTTPEDRVGPIVWLIEPDDLELIPKDVMTVYVMSDLGLSQLLYWARQMKDESSVLLFRKQALADIARK